jgi:bacterioferritin
MLGRKPGTYPNYGNATTDDQLKKQGQGRIEQLLRKKPCFIRQKKDHNTLLSINGRHSITPGREMITMHEASITLLNQAVADELSAVHQYMYFHFLCDDQGLDLLANLFKSTAIQEMIHIERLAERILFLKGEVEMAAAEPVAKLHSVKEMLTKATKMEEESALAYNKWANECAANADSVSKKLFEELVMDEERHFDQFDTELGHLAEYGDHYLALQSIERSKRTSMPAGHPPIG